MKKTPLRNQFLISNFEIHFIQSLSESIYHSHFLMPLP